MHEIIPDKRKIVGLVEEAYEGRLCPLDFQRDFVWHLDEIADLLRGLVRRLGVRSRSEAAQPKNFERDDQVYR